MNFLSSALSSLTGSSIPYTFKEKICDPLNGQYPDSTSVWTIYNGVNPKTDSPISIFEFDLKNPALTNANYESLARNCLKKLKLVKFPGIISIIDFIETDSFLYIITEPVMPLANYLNQFGGSRVNEECKIYGIYSVAQALLFINLRAQSVHGRLDLASSVFVNNQGEWKLFGFELLTSTVSDPEQPIYRYSLICPGFKDNCPDEVSSSGVDTIRQAPTKLDSYKLGAFIFLLLTSTKFDAPLKTDTTKMLSNNSKIPKGLAQPLKRLVSQKFNLRTTTERFLQETESFFNANRLVAFNNLLLETRFQNIQDKLRFFKNEVPHYIDTNFPPGYLDNKLLPEIIEHLQHLISAKPPTNLPPDQLQERQETIPLLLNYILKLGAGLLEDDFVKRIKPIIFQAFALLDRAVRLTLLNYLPQYAAHLTESDVQSKIFYNLVTGFQDTNFMIRETTLTSFTAIIDKVSVKQVNQDLLKALAKLQMDPKPSIRTNTLVLIIKVSPKIYSNSKNSVIITALAKSLRDTFTPCKITALSGFESLIDDFSLEEICSKILGHLAISLMDPRSAKVRTEAKRIFQLYLGSVEKHAATLPGKEEDEDAEEKEFFKKHAPSAPSESQEPAALENTASSSSGALSFGWNVMNKLVSSSAIDGDLNKSFNVSTPDLTRTTTPQALSNNNKFEESFAQLDVSQDDAMNDDWGVDYDVEFDESLPTTSTSTTAAKLRLPAGVSQKSRGQKLGSQNQTSLKLGSKNPDNQKKPGSTLKLDLSVEDEDSWGDEW